MRNQSVTSLIEIVDLNIQVMAIKNDNKAGRNKTNMIWKTEVTALINLKSIQLYNRQIFSI